MSLDPTIVYKYCGAFGVKVLAERRIRVTPPAEFNDPFEFQPLITVDISAKAARRHILDKDMIREMYSAENRRGSFKRYRKFVQENARSLSQGVHNRLEEVRKWADEEFTQAARSVGVFCTSSRKDGLLMWSHYADSHRGVAIGFDSADWRKGTRGFFKVQYRDDRPRLDLTDDALKRTFSAEKRYEAIKLAMSTKSPEWEYENEYRTIFSLKGTVRDSQGLHFKPFAPQLVKEVVLGARATDLTEKAVRHCLANKEFAHVAVRRAILHPSKFEISIVEAVKA